MTRLLTRTIRPIGMLCALLMMTGTAPAADRDPAKLMAAMQDAMVPTQSQLTRVAVSLYKDGAQDATRTWQALVARQRFEDGPRTAIAMMAPEAARGSAMLTAPRPEDGDIGLWLFSPSERRARQLAPLEADRHFLVTDFNYGDLGLAERRFVEPRLLGEETVDGRKTWKVEVAPADDWYYSRIITWIAQDTMLPLKREYYDRAFRLWKVVEVREAVVDDVPTVLGMRIRDVQTNSRSDWEVRAVSYDGRGVDKADLSATALGELPQQPFWQVVGYAHDGHVAAALAN